MEAGTLERPVHESRQNLMDLRTEERDIQETKSKRRSGSVSRERGGSSTSPSFSSLTCHSVQEEMQPEKLG